MAGAGVVPDFGASAAGAAVDGAALAPCAGASGIAWFGAAGVFAGVLDAGGGVN